MSRVRGSTRLARSAYRGLLRPLLFRYGGGDPERVHEAMIRALAAVPAGRRAVVADPVTVAGVRFPNRVGVAAGLDKDGLAAGAWARLGFGFAELGTVTAQPQPGNDQPRMFRLPDSRAVINRMGFNNAGAQALADRLAAAGVRRGEATLGIPLGVSIGKTKAVPLAAATDDYRRSLRALHACADYIAINVSSPNTAGLRSLQAASELARLLASLVSLSRELDARPVPILVKLAPDLGAADLRETLSAVNQSGASGIIATNTTLRRDGVAAADRVAAQQAGGLSGAPLTVSALAFVEAVVGGTSLPVIGVGGIMSPADAARMFDAGAQLVQLYTGFIYEGVALPRGINDLRRGR